MRVGGTLLCVGIVFACLVGGATWVVVAPREAPDVGPGLDAPTALSGTDELPSDAPATTSQSPGRTRRRVTSAPARDRRPRAEVVLEEVTALKERNLLEALERLAALMKVDPTLNENTELRALRLDLEMTLVRAIADVARELQQTGAAEAQRLLPLISDPGAARWLRTLTGGPDATGRSTLSDAEMRTVAGAESPDDAEALMRHLIRFGQSAGAAPVERSVAAPTDVQLNAVRSRFHGSRLRVRALPLDDADVREQRRLEQLEKLRQRESLGLLDHIHSGLAWLALHQGDDGSFSDESATLRCKELGHATPCVSERRVPAYKLAATALATLAFLDFRDQDALGLFEPTLSRSVAWLQGRVDATGFLGEPGYSAGIALMALGQAATSSHDPRIAEVLERAWTRHAALAGPRGGYRYRPHQGGDLSVTGWFVQAYEAARDAGVPAAIVTYPRLDAFISSVWIDGHKFAYTTSDYRPTLESVGMLSLLILRDDLDESVVAEWRTRLAGAKRDRQLNLYTLYYDVRVELALTGALSPARRETVTEYADWYQQVTGDAAGSFLAAIDKERLRATDKEALPTLTTEDRWFGRAGTTVLTAFSILTLEHALYRR